MAHWNEIDNISEKLLKKILLGENKADSIPSQEDHGRLTDKYKNWTIKRSHERTGNRCIPGSDCGFS